jgi:hypothetical protein
MPERLYTCLFCKDTGWEQIARFRNGRAYEAVTPCSCEFGIKLAAGYWRDRLSPFVQGGKRVRSDAGHAQFAKFTAIHPQVAARISAYLEEHPEPVPRQAD